MKVWAETRQGTNGLNYNLRAMHNAEEMQGLLDAGAILGFDEIVDMQDMADTVIAGFEKQIYLAYGGVVQ